MKLVKLLVFLKMIIQLRTSLTCVIILVLFVPLGKRKRENEKDVLYHIQMIKRYIPRKFIYCKITILNVLWYTIIYTIIMWYIIKIRQQIISLFVLLISENRRLQETRTKVNMFNKKTWLIRIKVDFWISKLGYWEERLL